MNISKSTYLFVLLIVGLRFCNLAFFAPVFEGIANHAILFGLILIYGYFKWGSRTELQKYKPVMRLWWLLMIGMMASYVTLYFEVGQSPIYSTWLYRDFLLTFLAIPVLLSIQITKRDILKATWLFSIFYGFCFLLSIISPDFIDENRIGEIDELHMDENDFGTLLMGFEYLTVPLYLLLSSYNSKESGRNDFLKIVYLYTIILLMQNRSVLFVSTAFTAFILWKSGGKNMRFVILIVIAMVLSSPSLNLFSHLISETQENLGDADANRSLAWAYFPLATFDSPMHAICGRGIQSTHFGSGLDELIDLTRMGIIPSDVGYFGFMYLYGIIPVLVFLTTSLIVAIQKKYSKATKMLGIHILVGGFTISFFQGYEHGLWYVVFFILMAIDQAEIKVIK